MAGDAIFLVQGDTLVRMDSSGYASEERLQRLLASFPDLLAGGRVNEAEPRRWLLVGREIGIPGEEGAPGRWSLDHLFLDQDGVPTLVEVKRSTDTRIRREVVGQMLDYAANGVRYWPIDDLKAAFRATHQDPDKKLLDLLGPDKDPDDFWEQVEENLRSGRVRLMFVADKIPTELQTIVEYLNEQMTNVDVLAVEITQYTGEGRQTLVPRVIGLTGNARHKRPTHGPDYETLLGSAAPEVRSVTQRLLEMAERDPNLRANRTHAGMRIDTVSGHNLLLLYPGKDYVQFNTRRLLDAGMEEAAPRVRKLLEELEGRAVSDRLPTVRWKRLHERWGQFETVVWPAYLAEQRQALGE